jgi:hypothetical protein
MFVLIDGALLRLAHGSPRCSTSLVETLSELNAEAIGITATQSMDKGVVLALSIGVD